MKIVRLSAKNVKRLRAVEVAPDGNVVVVSGRNGQGKSSLLDSIAYALGGKDVICREPIRRGEKRAEISCDLGELIVRRTFTEDGGGTLVVETKDGARFTSPQGRLDDLIGTLSFDPLAFARMEPKQQAETLRALLGLDFSQLDAERAGLFEKRTEVNRDGKALRARHQAMPAIHADVPAETVSGADILAEMEALQARNKVNEQARRRVIELKGEHATKSGALQAARDRAIEIQARIESLQVQLKEAESDITNKVREELHARQTHEAYAKDAAALVDVDLQPLLARCAAVDDTNVKVRENQANAELAAQLEAKLAEHAALTKKIEAIDYAKRQAIKAAKFPVEGLGFDEHGIVTFGDLPFEQASQAEQLRASVAIGIALNPKLRVLLVRDASLLDAESLRLISEMADSHDAQLWLERVEDGGATVVIEDGSVVEPAAAEEAAS